MARKAVFCLMLLIIVASPSVFAQFQRVSGASFEGNKTSAEFESIFVRFLEVTGMREVNRLPQVMFDDIFRTVNLYSGIRVGDTFSYGAMWNREFYFVSVRVTHIANGRATNIQWRAKRRLI